MSSTSCGAALTTARPPTEELIAAFKGAPRIDFKRFREDIDRFVDQDPEPRA